MDFRDLRSLGKETLIYGLSTVVARLLNFLLLPFYTHYLVPGDLGVVATLFAYIAFGNVVFQYGMDQAYLRHAARAEEDAKNRAFSTAYASLAATSAAFAAALYFLAAPLAGAGGLGVENAFLVRCAAGILALDALTLVPFAELRLAHRAWAYAGIRSLNILVNVAANVLFIAGIGLGVKGVFLAAALASSASLVMLAPTLWRRLRPMFDPALYKGLLAFGLPLIPAGLGAMMVQVIDRPILLRLTDKDTVGIYQANYRLGIFMLLIVSMFDQAWRPFFLERADKPGSGALFGRVLTYFLAGGMWVVLALSLFIKELVALPIGNRTLIHADYWPGLPVVPIILASYLFHGAYVNFIASVTIAKRTDLLVWVTFLGAGVNVAANLSLIPRLGMTGAAWATFASYASMAAALFVLGRRVHPIPYEWGRIAHLALAGAATVAIMLALRGTVSSTGGWLLVRAGGVILLPALLLLTRFFKPGELSGLK